MKRLMSSVLAGMLVTVGANTSLTKEKLYEDAKMNCHPLNVGNLTKCKKAFETAKVEAKKLKKVDKTEGKQIYMAEAKRIIAELKECKATARAKMQKCAKVYIEGTIKEAVRIQKESQLQQEENERKESIVTEHAETKRQEQQQMIKNVMKITNGQQLLEVIQQLVKSETAIAAKREIAAMREKMIELARATAKEEATKVARIEAQFVAKEEAVRVANAEVAKIQRDNELRLKSQDLAQQREEKERMAADKADLEQFMAETKVETFNLAQEEVSKLADQVREAAAEEAIRTATEEAVRVVKAEAARLSAEQFTKLPSSHEQNVITHVQEEEEVLQKVPVVVKVIVEATEKEGKAVEKPSEETLEPVENKESESLEENTESVESHERTPVLVEVITMNKSPVQVEILEDEQDAVKELVLSDHKGAH